MSEARKGGKKALIDAIESGQENALSPEDIESINVQVHRVSLKNWVVIMDHDVEDPIVSIHATLPPEE